MTAKDTPTERDPDGADAHAPGSKLDAGKARPWLMLSGFSRALAAVADVTTKGAAKYTPNGWAQVRDGSERYMEAFGRHTLALGRGETVDADTSCLHKAQMAWNLLASLELELREERPAPPKHPRYFHVYTREGGDWFISTATGSRDPDSRILGPSYRPVATLDRDDASPCEPPPPRSPLWVARFDEAEGWSLARETWPHLAGVRWWWRA